MAAQLTPVERLERQRIDQRMIAALDEADCPIRATGHGTAEDARANRAPISTLDERNPPSHYRVVYDFDTLRGPGMFHRPTIVHVAPLASGSYPATAPSAWVISDVVPWTPHFAAHVPVCHGGHVWTPNRTQLVDYVIHIGKLLNFDEPPPIPGYHGYNGAAVAYWREKMRLRPLDPGLRFPTISPEDVLRVGGVRRALTASPGPDRFRPASGAPAPERFRAVARSTPAIDGRRVRLGGQSHRSAKLLSPVRFAPAGDRG